MNQYKVDNHLWQLLKAGHETALVSLMQFHYNALYGYGLKISKDVEKTKDAIQNLFTYLWWKRDSLGEVKQVKSYLMTALRHELIKQYHKEGHAIALNVEIEQEPDISFTAEEQLIHTEHLIFKREILVNAVNSLPKRQKEIIYLKFVAELDSEAIATIMGLKIQSIYNLLSEALKTLKTLISTHQVLG